MDGQVPDTCSWVSWQGVHGDTSPRGGRGRHSRHSVIKTHKQRRHIAQTGEHQGADWVWCPAAATTDLVWVSRGGSSGSDLVCNDVQRCNSCAGDEEQRLEGGCGRRGVAVDQRVRRGQASLQDGDTVVDATPSSDAGDQQDATSANSSDSGEPPTRMTSSSGGPDLLTAAAGGGAGGRAGGGLADGLQADTRQRADGGDRRYAYITIETRNRASKRPETRASVLAVSIQLYPGDEPLEAFIHRIGGNLVLGHCYLVQASGDIDDDVAPCGMWVDEDGAHLVLKDAHSKRKHFRKKVDSVDDEDDEVTVLQHTNERNVRRCNSRDSDEDFDQEEREQLERNMRNRDAAATKKLADPRLARKEEEEAVCRFMTLEQGKIGALRKISRQEYLKKRKQKKMEELRDDIIDEEYLFEGVKLTDVDYRLLRYKRQIYELV
ncbi:hypothetical protein Scep_007976 [Stephania cephalantha]|uniref:Uncharacterized protein n=1 Tax=Stephania cephalantha TaxID=152367 RepID=A0AAP0KCL6_9MAGN